LTGDLGLVGDGIFGTVGFGGVGSATGGITGVLPGFRTIGPTGVGTKGGRERLGFRRAWLAGGRGTVLPALGAAGGGGGALGSGIGLAAAAPATQHAASTPSTDFMEKAFTLSLFGQGCWATPP
jgi:hypothetical protein